MSKFKRLISALLVAVMLITVAPTTGFVTEVEAAKTPTVYSQLGDYAAYNYPGGKGATYNSSGCGVYAVVNAVKYLTDKKIDPHTLGEFSISNGNRVNGGVNGPYFAKDVAKSNDFGVKYGFKCTKYYEFGSSSRIIKYRYRVYDKKLKKFIWKTQTSKNYPSSTTWEKVYNDLVSHLSNGEVAVVMVLGHNMAIVDYNPTNDTFLMLDSAANKTKRLNDNSGKYQWVTADQLNYNKTVKANSSYNNQGPYIQLREQIAFLKRTNDSNSYSIYSTVDKDSLTNASAKITATLNKKATVKNIGIFYSTTKSALDSVGGSTKKAAGTNYSYKSLEGSSSKTVDKSYSFNTANKDITLKSDKTYYYKIVFKIGDSWVCSGKGEFRTKADPPAAVSGLSVNEDRKIIGVNGKTIVTWKASALAESYNVTIKNKSTGKVFQSTDVKGKNSTTFTSISMPAVGTYTVSVIAKNSNGSSAAKSVEFTVKNGFNITFDSTSGQIENKFVEYNGSITAPKASSKEGYTFVKWTTKDGSSSVNANAKINNIKNSAEYIAEYTPNKYTIKIVDGITNAVVSSVQREYNSTFNVVEYVNDAKINIPTHSNYSFAGYSEDEFVVKNETRTVYTRYEWNSKNSLTTRINSVNHTGISAKTDGYNVNVTVSVPASTDTAVVRGRAVVALKSKAGRLMLETESSAFVLYPDSSGEKSHTLDIFVPFEAAENEGLPSVAEVYVVNNYTSAGIISSVEQCSLEEVNANLYQYTTDLNDIYEADGVTLKPGIVRNSDEKNHDYTKYDYTVKTTTTKQSLQNSLNGYTNTGRTGWVLKDSGSVNGYVESWPTPIGNSYGCRYDNTTKAGKNLYNTFNKEYKKEIKDDGKTTVKRTVDKKIYTYIYYHWCKNANNGNFTHNVCTSKYTSANKNNYFTFHCFRKADDSDIPYRYISQHDKWCYVRRVTSSSEPENKDVCMDSEYWFRFPVYNQTWTEYNKYFVHEKVDVQHYVTTDKSAIPTSGSTSTTEPVGNKNGVLTTTVKKDVSTDKTTVYYAYKSARTTVEDKNECEISGNVNTSIFGSGSNREVMVYVYKNGQLADFNTEFIGTATVDANGHFSIPDAQLREMCTYKTGNFTIAISLAGEAGSIYVGEIEPSDDNKEKFEVEFIAETDEDADIKTASESDVLIEETRTVKIGETQIIVDGGNAVLPDESQVPVRKGYHFVGWDHTGTNIKSNVTIKAVYERNELAVVFVDWESRTLSIQKVKYGDSYKLPKLPDTEPGMVAEWVIGDADDENSVVAEEDGIVTDDMIISVRYSKAKFEVELPENNFDDNDYIRVIESGDTIPIDEFEEMLKENLGEDIYVIGWINSATGQELDDITVTSDMSIYPVYVFDETTETPYANIENGEYNSAQTITLTCDTPNSVIFYTIDGTDPVTSETAIEYTEPITLTESCQLKYCASTLGMNDSGTVTSLYAINTATSGRAFHIVKIISNVEQYEDYAYEILMANGRISNDVLSDLINVEGYTFEYLYFDDDFTEEFDCYNENITDSVVLYANYIPKKYNVTFMDSEGNVIATEKVEYMNSAEPPVAPTKDGYVFVGWDSEKYELVTSNVTLTAKYVLESEYARITLKKHTGSYSVGSSVTLKYTITPYDLSETEIEWISSDEDIATVNENGTVTFVGDGTVTISATVVATGESDKCVFTVLGDPDKTLTLDINSYLGFDSAHYIRGVKTDLNTVKDIKAQFMNDNLKVFNSKGDLLADSDLVGTGATVELYEGDVLLDYAIVIMTGDVNCDGKINNRDAAYITRYIVEKENPSFEYEMIALDVNGDGKVNNRDASMLSRYLVGKEVL